MIVVESPVALSFLVSWLLTYLVHSTVLLGLAWIAARTIARHQPQILQMLWRGAILGAIVTATLQSSGGVEPIAGTIRLPGPEAPASSATHQSVTPGSPFGPSPNAARADELASATGSSKAFPSGPLWHLPVALLWLAGATLAVSRLGSSAWRLRRLMRDRRPFNGGSFLIQLARRMGLRRRVRLSLSDAVKMPFATGVVKPEICLPRGLATELGTAPSQALIAHEMAHLAHRDPAWQILYRLIAGCLFFQPLNRVARLHLENVAELLADDKAVACTGRRLDLARCLVEVAEHISSTAQPLPASAALGSTGGLDKRVERLLSSEHTGRRVARWAAPLLAGAISAVTLLVPGVSLSNAEAVDASDTQRTAAWPAAPAPPAAPDAPEPVAVTPPAPKSEPRPQVLAAQPSPAAPAAAVSPSSAPSPPAPPAPPSAAAIELEAMLERLHACERELHRVSEGLEEEQEARIEQLRTELERVRDHARQIRVEERIVRERSRELAREQERARDEQRRAAREQATEVRRQHEAEDRALREMAREAQRKASEAKRLTNEQYREMAARERELTAAQREEARRLAEVARKLELEARRKVVEEERRAAEERERREDDDGSIPE